MTPPADYLIFGDRFSYNYSNPMTDCLVRASALQGIRATVEELGGDADALLRRTALLEMEQDPQSWFSYRNYLLLLEEAARSTACPHFGLRLSQRQDVGMFGALGFVIQQAPDLRTALRELSTLFVHHNQGGIISLTVEDGMAYWRYDCKLGGYAPMWQQSDLAAGIGVDLMRLLLKSNWSPQAIYFPHAPPEDTRPYKARFNCPIYFNWDSSTMAFPAQVLDSPIHEANPELHQLLIDNMHQLQLTFGEDQIDKVRHLISQALTTGDCSIERVARFLSVNKRTLQRQLKASGTSYKQLLAEVRFDIAQRYLRETNGSLTTLSDMLCYSDLSVFSNAFRNYHGMSPRQWKNRQIAN